MFTCPISEENPKGEKSKGGISRDGTGTSCIRDLGRGWKVLPSVVIEPGQTYTQADIQDSGEIQSMWLLGNIARKGPIARFNILRINWENQEWPSVECPRVAFFALGWDQFTQVNSMPVTGNPNREYKQLLENAFPKEMPDHT